MCVLQHCSEKHKPVHSQNKSWTDIKSRDDVTVLVKTSIQSHLFYFHRLGIFHWKLHCDWLEYISNTDLMSYHAFACIRHFLVRRIGSRVTQVGCLLGTTHTPPPASLWPTILPPAWQDLGSHLWSLTESTSCSCSTISRQLFITVVIFIIIIIFEWNMEGGGDEENEDRMEMVDVTWRTKRRKIAARGKKHLTKEKWERKRKTKNESETDGKETGLRRRTRDRINVTSFFALIWSH